MKNILLIISTFFFFSLSFGQTYNNIYGKQNFKDTVKLTKATNNSDLDSILVTDADGRIKQALNPIFSVFPYNDTRTIVLTGSVIFDTLFCFKNIALTYLILGRNFSADTSSFCITGSDPVYDRYTIIYADTLGNVGFIDGAVGSPTPIPTVDPLSQILLATYFIPANSTQPYLVSNTDVYKENVEWTVSGTARINPMWTGTPYAGIYSVRDSSVQLNTYIDFVDSAGTHNLGDYTFLSFQLRLDAIFTNTQRLNITFMNDASVVSTPISLASGTYNYVRTTFGAYQLIAIPISSFRVYNATFNKIRITLTGSGANGFLIDNMILQTGGNNTATIGVNSFNNRIGDVLPQRTDYTSYFDSVRLNFDSSKYTFYNNGTLKDSVTTLRYTLIGDTCLIYTVSADTIYATFNQNCGGSGGGGNDSAYLNTTQLSDTSYTLTTGVAGKTTTFRFSGGGGGGSGSIDSVLMKSVYDAYLDSLSLATAINTKVSSQWTTTGSDIYYNTGGAAIGSTSINSKAILDLVSTTKGLLIPRMTTSERDAIASPPSGLLINNTTLKEIDQYDGTSWNEVSRKPSNFLKAAQILGSDILAEPVAGLQLVTTSAALTNQRNNYSAVYVPKEITITGVQFYTSTQGNFTGNNYNGVGLYSISGTTLTLIDSTTRDENIWKATSGTWSKKAFAGGSRVLQPGVYFLSSLYCSSAQTTAPSISAISNTAGSQNPGLTSKSFYGHNNTVTILPATTSSAFGAISVYFSFCLY